MAEVIQGRLGYNSKNNRYGLLVDDLREHDGLSLWRMFAGSC